MATERAAGKQTGPVDSGTYRGTNGVMYAELVVSPVRPLVSESGNVYSAQDFELSRTRLGAPRLDRGTMLVDSGGPAVLERTIHNFSMQKVIAPAD